MRNCCCLLIVLVKIGITVVPQTCCCQIETYSHTDNISYQIHLASKRKHNNNKYPTYYPHPVVIYPNLDYGENRNIHRNIRFISCLLIHTCTILLFLNIILSLSYNEKIKVLCLPVMPTYYHPLIPKDISYSE